MTKKPEKELPSHPSLDLTSRHSLDQLIRKQGYRIHERASGMLPIWLSREGYLINQEEVLSALDADSIADAIYEEDLRIQGFP